MTRKTTRADRPSSGAPVDAVTARGPLRAAAGVLLLGGLIFFAGVSRPPGDHPLVDVEQAAGDSAALNIAYLPGGFGLALGFVGLGILTWRGPAPRWAGVFGLVGVVNFRRRWPRKPYPPAPT